MGLFLKLKFKVQSDKSKSNGGAEKLSSWSKNVDEICNSKWYAVGCQEYLIQHSSAFFVHLKITRGVG